MSCQSAPGRHPPQHCLLVPISATYQCPSWLHISAH
ncbi:unnamed protein product, partial [Staurois parvus]